MFLSGIGACRPPFVQEVAQLLRFLAVEVADALNATDYRNHTEQSGQRLAVELVAVLAGQVAVLALNPRLMFRAEQLLGCDVAVALAVVTHRASPVLPSRRAMAARSLSWQP